MDKEELIKIWTSLKEDIDKSSGTTEHCYRKLKLTTENGIRLGVESPDTLEIFIEVEDTSSPLPNWKGMGIEYVRTPFPHDNTKQIRIYLVGIEYSDIFVIVCLDLIRNVENIDDKSQRYDTLISCLNAWNEFFDRFSIKGLSSESQRGLFGEIFWLNKMLTTGKIEGATDSWKQGILDFEYNGMAVEVKTTVTKEPRHVKISNEEQLNDSGYSSLILYVLSLQTTTGGSFTLPNLIRDVRNMYKSNLKSLKKFEEKLKDSGYLDAHEDKYQQGYIIRKEEAFHVRAGFPRIIEVPNGLGNISYDLFLAACADFEVQVNDILNQFMVEGN